MNAATGLLALGLAASGVSFPGGTRRPPQDPAVAEAKISAAQSKRARRAAKRQRDAERSAAGQRRAA